MIAGLNQIECVTLFVENVATARKFYESVFGLKVIYEDSVSAVVRFENILVNLLQISEAPTLVAPIAISSPSKGPPQIFTIRVPNVDAVFSELQKHQVKILNGPIDRPWGRRTLAFADPAGFVWEIAQEL